MLSSLQVRGCVDKNVFGKFGLVHAVQELYGNDVAGKILSSFSRLFTFYLQSHGFTCGYDDLLLVDEVERSRQEMLDRAEALAVNASAEFVGLSLGGDVLHQPLEHHEEMMRVEGQVRVRRPGAI